MDRSSRYVEQAILGRADLVFGCGCGDGLCHLPICLSNGEVWFVAERLTKSVV